MIQAFPASTGVRRACCGKNRDGRFAGNPQLQEGKIRDTLATVARLAQLVERVIDVDDVGGSSPSPRTKTISPEHVSGRFVFVATARELKMSIPNPEIREATIDGLKHFMCGYIAL